MTLAELERAVASKVRTTKTQLQEKASFDYLLADLIGKSVSRIYSSSAKMPEIYTVYPTLFDNEQVEQEKRVKKAELSALRFKLFAQSYNTKYKGDAKSK